MELERILRRTALGAAAVLLGIPPGCSAPAGPPSAGGEFRALGDARLPNAYWLTPRVLAGAQPEGAAGFKDLAALGVRTVISVDGARPDVDAARQAGLRYVHLPIGYDGVPEGRALELAKAIRELDGPVYIHCHHGQHRGPAAAAAGCVAAGELDVPGALAVLRVMGTGSQYLGLWASVREARKADPQALRNLGNPFRETAPVPPLVDSMVSLDAAFDRLQACGKAGWKPPAEHPDLDPAHEALGVREMFAEIGRTPECAARPAQFRIRMEGARDAASRLEAELRRLAAGPATGREAFDRGLSQLRQSCADCHHLYRNPARRK